MKPFSELRIMSEASAVDLVEKEPNKWNVVSLWAGTQNIYGKFERNTPKFEGAKRLCQEEFHDIVCAHKDAILCSQDHLWRILEFGRQVRGEPLLVHCHAGISRSTAVAVLLVLDAIKDESKQPFEDALNMVYRVRPMMYPNDHILNIGMPLVAKDEYQALTWYREAYASGAMRRIKGG